MLDRRLLAMMFSVVSFAACAVEYPTFGTIERIDPALDELLPKDAKLSKLCSGFEWAEGPLWLKNEKSLIFSDVPKNVIYQWREGLTAAEPFLTPSGYTGSAPLGGHPGSNGLTLDKEGHLVLCEHGNRRVGRYDLTSKARTSIANSYNGKKFNSPNDVVIKSNGDVYFTDPPYGLEKGWDDPTREQPHSGVYRVSSKDGIVTLLTDKLPRPNGLAFSPDEKILYVAQSDSKAPYVMAYNVKCDGTLDEGKILFDATPLGKSIGKKVLPDGLKVDTKGNLWCTAGFAGVLIITPAGKHLGSINTGEDTANCAFGEDGSVLYITAHMHIGRIKTNVKGCGF